MDGREGKRRIPPRQRPSSFRTIAYLMLLPVAGLLLFLLWNFINHAIPPRPEPASAKPKPVAASIIESPKKNADHRGDIVLILDDVGFDRQPVAAAMTIDPSVNFAVLPNSQHAAAVANTLHARGFEILCHLPMEPQGFPRVSPGENAVLTTMNDAEIAVTTRSSIEGVPFARGVNNHMGSRATADRRVMTAVLESLPHGMYFVDSRTTPDSVAASVARSMSIRTATRNVFLDDVATQPAVRAQLAELARDAETRGVAVGIGHMYPATISVLTADAPSLRARGFRFVRASAVVR
jgi:polysaccharide deacetylase 2 family uncharacterized protein YibQ